MNINFKNQNVLVTGATRGIGRQIAEDMLSCGANVIVTGTSKLSLENLTDDFLKFPVNFLNKKSSQDFIDFISSKKIDVCINNAGINKIDEIENINKEDWDSIIEVNLSTPFKIIKEVSKSMKKNGYGRIVNISSIWGVISKEYRGPYSSSKFGLVGLTLATAAELAKYNILVNAVSPGFTLTDLTRNVLGQEEISKITQLIPAGRMGDPADISKVVMFIASRQNSYISGQNIIVDGGFSNVWIEYIFI